MRLTHDVPKESFPLSYGEDILKIWLKKNKKNFLSFFVNVPKRELNLILGSMILFSLPRNLL